MSRDLQASRDATLAIDKWNEIVMGKIKRQPSSVRDARAHSSYHAPDLLQFYRKMYEIRKVEQRLEELFRAGEIYGSLHLCIGQEATVTGACAALGEDDYITATYRGHGATLAKGTSAKAVIAELFGRETGCCRGRSGSMLLSDASVGNLGCSGIVAGGIPIAVGAALGVRLAKNGRVALAFFGEGATNQGAFHESLNMAALWKLPCIFFCENNLYAEMTPISKEASVDKIAERVCAYGMPGVSVDGNDVEAVFKTTSEAVARARQGEGPTLIEAMTYRLTGHMFGDPQTYKPKEEVDLWRSRDPLLVARRKLAKLKAGTVEKIEREVDAAVEEAVAFARQSPEPKSEEAMLNVYLDPPASS
ncbi:MAG: thiamine pyrophosphate-dependent dehydrogenase E1 component subunit alpha [Candidatus Sulfotelmatobacter sp.]